ncbi:peptidoglycan DD-metalloendopeptidase family protein [Alicyclobacillus sp. SO9]|uniref:peptidoglycan DD-metalloendopeptidase family protein n=1 Tax=Alicyclobacillus sp. SO9 TaxID=2665646 RepID=UPI0018E88D02|nr:peptidoglycan DD-metalloendopeptidase family protein [Alicyclobacillus sp. SO9]QQE77003.1 peptidoglycan DD-metalloendopeptidase family protein [Alicyclobacillus sp. SO9]
MSNRDGQDKNASKFAWGRLFSKSGGNTVHQTEHESETEYESVEDNPWFQTRGEQPDDVHSDKSRNAQSPRGRWLYDDGSPYGFSDEDGTLKQVDSANWRRAFGKPSKKGFNARSGTGSRWQGQTPGVKSRSATGSTWLLQSLAAVALVAGGLYVSHAQGPFVKQVDGVYRDAFTQDYSSKAVPAMETFLQNHHVNLPVEWNPSSAIHLHVPLKGKIVHDYSVDHPEITLRGTANESVLAAGSGNVVRITKGDTGSIIIINHGKVGESVYTGVVSVGVKVGQYVSSGQVIGHLPASGNPALQFGFEHNGQFVNPHDYIHFPAKNS